MLLVRPQCDGIAHLLVGCPEQGVRQEQHQQHGDRAPFVAIERPRALDIAHLVHLVGWQARVGVEINREPDQHADSGGHEAVVPADFLAQRAAHQRGEECAEVDPDIEDRIRAIAARIARRVKAADLRRDIGLEGAVAENQSGEREEEQRLEGHEEVADRHQHGADDHRAALTEHAGRRSGRRTAASDKRTRCRSRRSARRAAGCRAVRRSLPASL